VIIGRDYVAITLHLGKANSMEPNASGLQLLITPDIRIWMDRMPLHRGYQKSSFVKNNPISGGSYSLQRLRLPCVNPIVGCDKKRHCGKFAGLLFPPGIFK
jgi:hypothetical protein